MTGGNEKIIISVYRNKHLLSVRISLITAGCGLGEEGAVSCIAAQAPAGIAKNTNLTGEEIPCIRVFYRFYIASDDVYIGGITYTSKILSLAAGETTTITPSRYAKGYLRHGFLKGDGRK